MSRRVGERVPGGLPEGRRAAGGGRGGLARRVWRALPPRARRRASVATWAFANGNRFDLFAAPRLATVALDPSYLDPAAPLPLEPPGPSAWEAARPRLLGFAGAAVVL